MTSIILILTLTFLSNLTASQRVQYANIVALVNQSNVSWTAALSPDLNYDDPNGLKARLGAILSFNPAAQQPASPELSTQAPVTVSAGKRPRKLQTTAPVSAYPSSLDLRVKYPKCRSIAAIRNQGPCGSCWAFATINSLSDRYCIAKSTVTTTAEKFFSVGAVLECCASCNGGSGNGCRGGIPYYAAKHAQDVGVVSGEILSIDGGLCKPYYLDLKLDFTVTAPLCKPACTNPQGYLTPYDLDRTKSTGVVYGVGEQQMIAALNNGGSIASAMLVYEDFFAYKSGIYTNQTGQMLGGHAIRIIGYGVENDIPFWRAANSWGSYWGETGFFRIRRGTNESGIEGNYFIAGTF